MNPSSLLFLVLSAPFLVSSPWASARPPLAGSRAASTPSTSNHSTIRDEEMAVEKNAANSEPQKKMMKGVKVLEGANSLGQPTLRPIAD